MNGKPLPVAHGAPLRLRVERHVGYKHAKYVNRIEAVDRLSHIARGKGGFWEDRGHQWYTGLGGWDRGRAGAGGGPHPPSGKRGQSRGGFLTGVPQGTT